MEPNCNHRTIGLNIYALFAELFPDTAFLGMFAVMILNMLLDIFLLPLEYHDKMKIEDKYGFNRSTKGTFWGDKLKEFLFGLITNYFSRKKEYRADAQAVKEGYGEALISALKKLAKSDYANLSPDPLVVKLTYSHPTLSQRFDAIRKIK